MGGRRSKKVRQVFGSGNRGTKIKLTRAIKEKNVEQMTLAGFNLFFESKKMRNQFSHAVRFMNVIAKEAAQRNGMKKGESDKFASKVWADIKDKERIETTRELDKVLVSSASEVLRRKKNE